MLAGLTGLLGGGGAAGSFESIATVSGAGTSSITFSSIPSTYKHLQIRYIGKTSSASYALSMYVGMNGDTGSNYVRHGLYGDGTTAGATGAAASGFLVLEYSIAGSNTANVMAAGVIDIHDYTSTSKNKTLRAFTGSDGNVATTQHRSVLSSGLWLSTAAVSSITLTTAAGTIDTTSRFALYGIKG